MAKTKDGRRTARGRISKGTKANGCKQAQPPKPRIVYSDDLAAAICEHVADGMALKEACLLDGMPSRRTAYKWLGEHDSFVRMYVRAREERADLIADEIVEIADTDPDPNRARVRIDARKWWAAKVNPKAYGDKITTENTNTNYNISDKPLTQDEWTEKYTMGSAVRTSESTH